MRRVKKLNHTYIWSIDFFTKIQKQLNGEKIIFSTNSTKTIINKQEKRGEKEMQFIPNTTYKNEFKINSIPKCNTKLPDFRKLLEKI